MAKKEGKIVNQKLHSIKLIFRLEQMEFQERKGREAQRRNKGTEVTFLGSERPKSVSVVQCDTNLGGQGTSKDLVF